MPKRYGASKKMHDRGHPNLEAAALVVVDMQHDFLDPDGAFLRAYPNVFRPLDTQMLIEANRRAIDAMHSLGRPVIFIRIEHRADQTDHAIAPPYVTSGFLDHKAFIEGGRGVGLVDTLKALPTDYDIVKKGHGSFQFTHLDRLLKSLRVRDCIYTGGALGGCVSDTVYQGDALGYRQWLVTDALYPLNETSHRDVLTDIAGLTTSVELQALADRQIDADKADSTGSDPQSALLLLGLQNDFLAPGGACPATDPSDADQLVRGISVYVKQARERGWRVIHAPFLQRADQLDSAAPRGWPCDKSVVARGSWGAALVDDISALPDDIIVERSAPSAFAYTPLLRILRNLGVEHLAIAGGDVRQSISATIRDAAGQGIDVTVLKGLIYPPRDPHLDQLSNRAVISAEQQ